MCSQCVINLKTAFLFKNQCIRIDTELRNLIISGTSTGRPENLKMVTVKGHNEQIPFKITSKENINEEITLENYVCHICNQGFSSYYQLSFHSVVHSNAKTLTDRFVESRNANLSFEITKDSDEFQDKNRTIVNRDTLLENSMEFDETTNENEICESIDTNNISDNLQSIQLTPISCKLCSLSFDSQEQFVMHICKSVTKDKYRIQDTKNVNITICTLCDMKFSDSSKLSIHFINHLLADNITSANIKSEFFFCEICGQTFDNNLMLNRHYNECHSGRPEWKCWDCHTTFYKEQDLLKHNNIFHLTKRFNEKDCFLCVLCIDEFSTKHDLLEHAVSHLMKKYLCKKCSISYCTRQSYYAHLKLHTGNKHSCSMCGKHLSTKNALKAHIAGVHPVDLQHVCPTCGKSFSTSNRLKTHSFIHTENKKYVCSYCGYSAHKGGDLQIHIRTHTSERPYKCTFAKCTMRFKTSSHLCDHIRRHLKIRKFKCNICLKSFSTNHGLKIHHMQHTGEKPFNCMVCNQKFRRKYHVKVHMKLHDS